MSHWCIWVFWCNFGPIWRKCLISWKQNLLCPKDKNKPENIKMSTFFVHFHMSTLGLWLPNGQSGKTVERFRWSKTHLLECVTFLVGSMGLHGGSLFLPVLEVGVRRFQLLRFRHFSSGFSQIVPGKRITVLKLRHVMFIEQFTGFKSYISDYQHGQAGISSNLALFRV